MNNLKPLVWHGQQGWFTTKSPLTEYRIVESGNKYKVYYTKRSDQFTREATGFANIDEAKAWAWSHYQEKMQPYIEPDTTQQIVDWFQKAKPEPTDKDRLTQIGCHYEEVSEMMVACHGAEHLASKTVDNCARGYKSFLEEIAFSAQPHDHIELLDALCDQIVTALGVGYMMGFDMQGALKEVIRSNNSKFEDGKPIFNEQGKIMKGKDYSEPDLTPFLK